MTPLRIAIAGLGTVGSGVLQLVLDHADDLAQRCQRPIIIVGLSDLYRPADLPSGATFYGDALAMVRAVEADVVVELIGGADGIARQVVETAMSRRLSVVSANKALIARHGNSLLATARQAGVSLLFEAAIAGGIPVVKTLREGLIGDRVVKIGGILNGTCNYILSAMASEGVDFNATLADAQKLGYAEADPSFDIDGIDAAHKLAVLTGLAWRAAIDFEAVFIEGIRTIKTVDIGWAGSLGYTLRHLAIAECLDGIIRQRVHPCLLDDHTALSQVDGVLNAVDIRSTKLGQLMLTGPGAGASPTACAVVADLGDIACGRGSTAVWGQDSSFKLAPSMTMADHSSRYYLRLYVADKPGVIAEISGILGHHGISVETILQQRQNPHPPLCQGAPAVPVVITTHLVVEQSMIQTVKNLSKSKVVVDDICFIRIEDWN